MAWPAIIAALVPVVLAVIKGLWGTDKPVTTTTVDVDGAPVGPKLAEKLRKLAAAGAVLLMLSGCTLSPTIGPRVEDRIVFVKYKGVAARVSENKSVEVIVEKDGKVYKQKMDIGGFYVISPDMKEE